MRTVTFAALASVLTALFVGGLVLSAELSFALLGVPLLVAFMSAIALSFLLARKL